MRYSLSSFNSTLTRDGAPTLTPKTVYHLQDGPARAIRIVQKRMSMERLVRHSRRAKPEYIH